MRRAVYPGSFDPITLGHVEILRHASALFDEVVVAIMHNPGKQPFFDVTERMRMTGCAAQAFDNVSVDSFSGLLVDYCRIHQFNAVVRGIRNAADAETEMQMAQMNASLYPEIHTVFLPTSPKYVFVSSSLVKDVAMHGGDVTNFVTEEVKQALSSRLFGRSSDAKR